MNAKAEKITSNTFMYAENKKLKTILYKSQTQVFILIFVKKNK